MCRRRAFGHRRNQLVTSLRAACLETFVAQDGSLFLFLRVPGSEGDRTFCRRLLEEQHLVAVPGSAFGLGGEGSIRISFGATPAGRQDEVVRRIANVTC